MTRRNCSFFALLYLLSCSGIYFVAAENMVGADGCAGVLVPDEVEGAVHDAAADGEMNSLMDSAGGRLAAGGSNAGEVVALGFLRSIGVVIHEGAVCGIGRSDRLEVIERSAFFIDIDRRKRFCVCP